MLRPSRALREALFWAAFLAGYGNAFSLVAGRLAARQRAGFAIAGPLALLAMTLAWHRRVDGLPLAALGLHRRGWRRSLAWGTLAGAALAVLPAGCFRLAHRGGATIRFDEIHEIGLRALLVRLLVTTPVLVAFVEEAAFRGLLQGKLLRAWPEGPWWANLISSLSFTLWHVVVNVRTLRETNVVSARLLPLPLALLTGLASVFVGGLVFGGVYQRTGNLIGPVLAHWLVDVLMLLALYRRPTCPRDTADAAIATDAADAAAAVVAAAVATPPPPHKTADEGRC
jgi:membrane protease YdiL (CAAX protease family)